MYKIWKKINPKKKNFYNNHRKTTRFMQ